MEEKMKALALQEFGTLEGVTITYSVDSATGRINYCFTRRQGKTPRRGGAGLVWDLASDCHHL